MTTPLPADAAGDTIAVTFSMTADDYARYFAIIGRQESRQASLVAYVAALFAAIPVALALRAIAAHHLREPAAADLVGQLSLAAFLLGAFSMLAAGLWVRRIAVRQHIAGTLNAFSSKTAIFDASGVTLTGQISQAMWQWPAITRFTSHGGLFLIWVGQSAPLVIPARSFGDENAREAAAAFIRARMPAPQPAPK